MTMTTTLQRATPVLALAALLASAAASTAPRVIGHPPAYKPDAAAYAVAAAGYPASQARPAHPVTAYVIHNNFDSDTVTPIRTATNMVLKPITVGKVPWAIAITPDGKTAYVANTQTVTPIRIATGTAGTAIPVGDEPFAIAITP
jgi:YVTN family beta-propeller protein